MTIFRANSAKTIATPNTNTQSTKSFTITADGIEKLLKSPKHGEVPGLDGLRKDDLCVDSLVIYYIPAIIFNKPLENGSLLSSSKVANVTPIHKKGPTDSVSNYRLISLTPISCKLLEHIILHELNKKLDSILQCRQYFTV